MAERIVIVESDDRAFERWTHPTTGVAAQVENMGGVGSQVEVERISTAADLLELAHEIKTADHLPARALVLGRIAWNSDLTENPYNGSQNHIADPDDFDEATDPTFAWRGDDGRPLDPYGRFIANRLIQKAIPDVSYRLDIPASWEWPEGRDLEAEAVHANPDLYTWASGPMDSSHATPKYGGFLARVNQTLALSREPFMSVVDFTDTQSRSQGHYTGSSLSASGRTMSYDHTPVEGADIVDSMSQMRPETSITQVAHLALGHYPETSPLWTEKPDIPRKTSSNV